MSKSWLLNCFPHSRQTQTIAKGSRRGCMPRARFGCERFRRAAPPLSESPLSCNILVPDWLRNLLVPRDWVFDATSKSGHSSSASFTAAVCGAAEPPPLLLRSSRKSIGAAPEALRGKPLPRHDPAAGPQPGRGAAAFDAGSGRGGEPPRRNSGRGWAVVALTVAAPPPRCGMDNSTLPSTGALPDLVAALPGALEGGGSVGAARGGTCGAAVAATAVMLALPDVGAATLGVVITLAAGTAAAGTAAAPALVFATAAEVGASTAFETEGACFSTSFVGEAKCFSASFVGEGACFSAGFASAATCCSAGFAGEATFASPQPPAAEPRRSLTICAPLPRPAAADGGKGRPGAAGRGGGMKGAWPGAAGPPAASAPQASVPPPPLPRREPLRLPLRRRPPAAPAPAATAAAVPSTAAAPPTAARPSVAGGSRKAAQPASTSKLDGENPVRSRLGSTWATAAGTGCSAPEEPYSLRKSSKGNQSTRMGKDASPSSLRMACKRRCWAPDCSSA